MKVFLIDSENVGTHWIKTLNDYDNSIVVVFYTSNSPKLEYSDIAEFSNRHIKLEVIECEMGKNALDFQLSSELGYRICQHEDDEYHIVSNDMGYDAVVEYWSKQKISIKRDAVITNINKVTNIVCMGTAADLKKSNPALENAKSVLCSLGINRKEELHTVLVQMYGNKQGSKLYNTLKEQKFYKTLVEDSAKLSASDKRLNYIRAILNAKKINVTEEGIANLITAIEEGHSVDMYYPDIKKCIKYLECIA